MRVYFIIKANSTEYIHYMDVPPKPDGSERPAKECCAEVKERVRKESGRNRSGACNGLLNGIFM